MSQQIPLVSIGMPVRNGQKYIREAIDSLLAQTFGDLEVVICDNCSADATEEICREYMRHDDRVRYFRNERDLGPAQNHTRCFENARGTYFRWHAHDDLCAPRYLERVVPVLQQDPTVANAHCLTQVIDDQGQPLREYKFRTATDSPAVSKRFGRLINVNHRKHYCYEIFGLMRRAQMSETPLEGAYPHGDRVFLVRMSLRGRFYEVPEPLFLARSHSAQSIQQKTTRAKYFAFLGTGPLPPAEWWDASKKGKAVYPEWKLLSEYWRSIGEVPISLADNLRCRLWVGEWVLRNLPKLGRDVAYGLEHFVTRRGASPATSTASQQPVMVSTQAPPAAPKRTLTRDVA